jgi:UDP-galactopyranose mutase
MSPKRDLCKRAPPQEAQERNAKMKSIAIIGAGFSGAVLARELALKGHKITVFESRNHVAGNCHTAIDEETNIMLHVYGPHIFHTSNERVWKYIQQFDEITPFVNRVKAQYKKRIYSLPINLLTINTFFGKNFSPAEAEKFIRSVSDTSIEEPKSFEEQALRFIGRELYEAFLKGYTEKQWGIHPSELPASVLKRMPVRFNYDDNYYESKYQGIPRNGYTYIIERILSHDQISVMLGSKFDRSQAQEFSHIFYSGPLDGWFNYSEGRLSYRTLDFEIERYNGDFQGTAVMNYSDRDVPFTRISEHKHFSPWKKHEQTIIYKEYSRSCDVDDMPYYPIRLVNDKALLSKYIRMAESEENVTFIGRLGTYRYLDMHVTIQEAFDTALIFSQKIANRTKMPAFTFREG